ncbi:hypothetical protein ACS0TY_012166 [Phlomoides rotata]
MGESLLQNQKIVSNLDFTALIPVSKQDRVTALLERFSLCSSTSSSLPVKLVKLRVKHSLYANKATSCQQEKHIENKNAFLNDPAQSNRYQIFTFNRLRDWSPSFIKQVIEFKFEAQTERRLVIFHLEISGSDGKTNSNSRSSGYQPEILMIDTQQVSYKFKSDGCLVV